MSEILTESFCERCGTRYTFETHTPRAGRFGKLKVLSKGLKNYVLSDESSLDEALADARSDQDRAASGQQLDAFHKTFNFCMSCRQYTCANCWNEAESRCLSCAPHLGHEVLEAPFQTADPFGRIASIGAEAVGNGHEPDLETLLRGSSANATAWPETDLGVAEPVEEQGVEVEPEADAVTRLESLFAIATQPEEPVRDVPRPTATESPAVVPSQPAAASAEPSPAKPPAVAPVAPTPVDAPPAPKAASTGKPAKPARDIALEVSLFEEDAAHDGAEAVFTVPEPLTPAAEIPQVAADDARPAVPSSESDELDDRTAAAMSQTADLLARFRTTSGPLPATPAQPTPPAAGPPEPAVPAAASEPEPAEQAAAPAEQPAATVEQPAAAEPARPRVDRIEAPTWHVDTPSAPAALPNGHPPEPAIIPTPGPALRPSVQARWPATPPKDAPSSPVPTALPPAAPIPPQTPPPAIQATALPAAQVPEAEPQWPAAPAWPAGQPSSTPSWPIDPSAAPSWPASQPGAAGSWPAGQSRASRVSAVDAIWAASSRDVLNRPETGVQACVNCGLPLSSTARFCRRCGANQLQA